MGTAALTLCDRHFTMPLAILKSSLLPLALTAALLAGPAAAAPRALSLADTDQLREVQEPRLSPDGQWVAYTVRVTDNSKDKLLKDLWISSTRADATALRLSFSGDIGGQLRWSPQGQWLSFVAGRGADEAARKVPQVWRLNRSGGEAEQLTHVKGEVLDHVWSPDGKRLLLVVADADPRDEPETMVGWMRKTRPPIVIDRFHFKQDREGYLGPQNKHLVLFDIASASTTPLTSGAFSETAPAWSPDGKRVSFLSQRGADADRSETTGLFVMDVVPGAVPRQLASFTTDGDAVPVWSPDGSKIAFLQGDPERFSAYQRYRPAVVNVSGGAVQPLSDSLDRGFQARLAWSADGRSLLGVIDDDRSSLLVRVPLQGEQVDKLSAAGQSVSELSAASDGQVALLTTSDKQPPEVALWREGKLQRLSHHNDAWLADIDWGRTTTFSAPSADGTDVHGLLTLPPGTAAGRQPLPTVLLIHGGPNGQDSHGLTGRHLLRELLSASGYAVLQVNYRGSSGRGDAFQKAIYADWGHKEVLDLQGAVDWAVKQGIADPKRLGVGGWSYGGILTDYLIASDTRFKAAVSGAGSANQLSMFGVDQYAVQYAREIGPPWQTQDLWLKLSYPFFKADRIKTPTLFMGGALDFNVPIAGGEQMYQALKMLGVDTQLVIYPEQFHGISQPSYRRDIAARYIAWFDKYLKTP